MAGLTRKAGDGLLPLSKRKESLTSRLQVVVEPSP